MADFNSFLVSPSSEMSGAAKEGYFISSVTEMRPVVVGYGDGGYPISAGASIQSIVVLSSTSIRINFLLPLVSNPALSQAENYSISPSIAVLLATPEAVAEPSYVILTIGEMLQSQAYLVTIHTFEVAS